MEAESPQSQTRPAIASAPLRRSKRIILDVPLGQTVLLMNPKNWDEREATIAFVGPPYAGLATVGIEFARPSPEFWAISAPPAEWNLC